MADTLTGLPGTVAGFTATGGDDAVPRPCALRARTVQFTVTPFVSPITTSGEAAPVFDCDPHVAV
jgi:hypothetical protein